MMSGSVALGAEAVAPCFVRMTTGNWAKMGQKAAVREGAGPNWVLGRKALLG
jgi:hypothetical protein